MSTLGEIENALMILLDHGNKRENIYLLQCTSSYPTPSNEVNLLAIKTLLYSFSCPVGFSDHSDGITASIAAVALGATVIEKHLTLDHMLKGPDHKASLEPSSFYELVKSIRSCESMLGNGYKVPMPCEINTMKVARKSIHAVSTIKPGDIFTISNIHCIRPSDGLPPSFFPKIIGTKSTRYFNEGDPLVFSDLT